MKRLLLLLALTGVVFPRARGQVDASPEAIREGGARQEQLRGDTQKLVGLLDSLIDEYQRNGLGGEDIQTLRALRDSLARLSAGEMKQVVDLLGKAGATVDTGVAKQRVADAYTNQKAILSQMGKLLAQHQRNQQAEEISEQLAKLADRQAVNLRNGITLGQWTAGENRPDNFETAAKANLEGQQGEQEAIANELKMLAQRMMAFAKDQENAEQAARFQKGLETLQKLQPSVDAASASLNGGQVFKAVDDEKTARDAMRRLARDVAPPRDRPESLRSAERDLAQAIEDQSALVQETQKAEGEQDFDHWLEAQRKLNPRLAKMPLGDLQKNPSIRQQFEAQRNGQPEALAGLEGKQGDLAGRSDEIAQSLAKNAPEAAQDVTSGIGHMQEARESMADSKAPAAAKNAQEALAALQTADEKLKQALARAEAMAGKSGDPVKDLQALGQQALALAQQQAEAARIADKSGQPALAQKIEEFARQAAAMSPKAAPSAQQAATNAQQAAQAPQPAAATTAQQAAAQALVQAAQQLGQQVGAAQQAQQQAEAAQRAQDQLVEIINGEQKLKVETAKGTAGAAQDRDKSARRETFQGQASRQQELTTQTGEFKKTLPSDAATANTALDAAQAAMTEAKQAIEKPEGEPALAAEGRAIEQLYAAQKALQSAQAQAAAKGDGNGEQGAQQAAGQVAEAREELAKAEESLQQAQKSGQPGAAQQAAGQLADAAQKVNQAAVQAPPGNTPAEQALQAGAQAAAEAAAQAAMQNLPAAQAQAAAAQQALAQAQAALSRAQAGLTAANTPGQPAASKPSIQSAPKPGEKPGPQSSQPAQQDKPETSEQVKVSARPVVDWKTAFTSLPPRERAVIEQAQSEKYPEEYRAQIEQYLLNLARDSTDKK
jgi:hypothetical protein